jgi:hypothetical protein
VSEEGPAITVGIIGGEGETLERTSAAVSRQLRESDSLLITARFDIPDSAACNAILLEAEGEVVSFLKGGAEPLDGWLESVRLAFLDRGVDAVAGAIDPPPSRRYPGIRPGGQLRWTGHLAVDYASLQASTSSLASIENCAVRREVAIKLGGFDETFDAGWPYADVEFFTRLAKSGGRTLFVPEARIILSLDEVDGVVKETPDEVLADRAARSRSMAVIFARHEAWALLIMVASHLLKGIVDVFASLLPRRAPLVIAGELITGIKIGVRPAAGRISSEARLRRKR